MTRVALGLVACVSLVACASLVGLDPSDPEGDGSSSSGEPPGTTSSSSGGSTTQDGITITPTQLVLPNVKCAELATGTISLTTDSEEEQTYEASLPTNDAFTIKSGASGRVKAGANATITLEAKSGKPGAAVVDVAIKTKSKVSSVNVKTEIQGGTLTVTPLVADFGFVKEKQVSAPINAIFANEGNVPVTITGFDGPEAMKDFSLPTSTLVIPAGGSVTKPLTMGAGEMTGSAVTAGPVTAIVDPSSNLCSDVPSFTLKGQRVSDDIVVNPASADFSSVDCNAGSGTKQTLTISNFSQSEDAIFTTTLPAGTRFKVTPTSGTVQRGAGGAPGKLDLTVEVPNGGDEPKALNETLRVDITSPKVLSYDVKLTVKVVGALITVDPASLDNIPQDGNKTATVTNAGNAQVCLFFSSDSSRFSVPGFPPTIISAGQQGSVRVSFSSMNSGTFNGNVSMTRGSDLPCFGAGGAVLCKPAPTLPVSGVR